MRTRLAVAAPTVAIGLVLVLAASGAVQRSDEAARKGRQHLSLRVSGGVRGLYPGARLRLRLKVRNTRGFPIRVVSLKVRVGNASRGCRRRQLRIGRFHRALVVPAHRSRRAALPVTMLRSAPDACKGAVFPLRFRALGRRA
jgi:hypothetical protein